MMDVCLYVVWIVLLPLLMVLLAAMLGIGVVLLPFALLVMFVLSVLRILWEHVMRFPCLQRLLIIAFLSGVGCSMEVFIIFIGGVLESAVVLPVWLVSGRDLIHHVSWFVWFSVPVGLVWGMWLYYKKQHTNMTCEQLLRVDYVKCSLFLWTLSGPCLYMGIVCGMPATAAVLGLVSWLGACVCIWKLCGIKKIEQVCYLPFDLEISDCLRDELARDYAVGRLRDWLRKNVTQKARILGMYGRWGSGKTFLLHYISREMPECQIVSANLWQCSTEKELEERVIRALETAYFGTPRPHRHIEKVARIFSCLGGIPQILSDIIQKTCIEYYEQAENEQFRQFRNLAEQKPVFLLLDNVERTRVDILHSLLPLVERLRVIPSLTIVLSVARDSYHYQGKQGLPASMMLNGAMQKMVEYSFYMPPVKQKYARDFFREQLQMHGLDSRCFSYMLADELEFDTPRQIKRVAQALALCEGLFFDYQWVREYGGWNDKELENRIMPIVKPVLLLTVLHSQYEAMFNILREHAACWSAEQQMPDLDCLIEGKMPNPTSNSLADEYMKIMREYNLRHTNVEARYQLMTEETLDYVHDLLFASVMGQLNRSQTVFFIDAVSQNYAYNDELTLFKGIYIVHALQDGRHVLDVMREVLNVQPGKAMDTYILELAKMVAGVLDVSGNLDNSEIMKYVAVFVQLVCEHKSQLRSQLPQLCKQTLGVRGTPYFLYYPFAVDENKKQSRLQSLRDFFDQLPEEVKAHVYHVLKCIDDKKDSSDYNAAWNAHLKSIADNISSYDDMRKEFRPVYKRLKSRLTSESKTDARS